MRLAAATMLGFAGLLALGGTATRAEYYCSPGFEPSYGGRCIATAARDEVQLYLNDASSVYDGPVVRHRHHRRHGVRARY